MAGKIRRFFLFAFIAGIAGAAVSYFRRRQQAVEETEWQELPPPVS